MIVVARYIATLNVYFLLIFEGKKKENNTEINNFHWSERVVLKFLYILRDVTTRKI